MVVHLFTVGGVCIKSFILLLNGRVNSSICVWVVGLSQTQVLETRRGI